MASTIKTFLEEINEVAYHLIAIHTTLEDYRLAYFINKHLPVNLKKCKKDLHVKVKQGETYFARFHYEDEDNSIYWDLLENKNIVEGKKNELVRDLFSNSKTSFSVATYLLPEYKKVNFLLKIESEKKELEISEFVSKINTIDKIAMVYSIDKNNIKSKDNLIF